MFEITAALGHARDLGAGQAFEEIADIDLEEPCDVPELGCRNPVGTFFVFLDLLKRQAEGPAQIALIVSECETLLAHTPTDMPVYGMRTILALTSRHCPLILRFHRAKPECARDSSVSPKIAKTASPRPASVERSAPPCALGVKSCRHGTNQPAGSARRRPRNRAHGTAVASPASTASQNSRSPKRP